MATATGRAPSAEPEGPRARRWTRAEYHQLAIMGLFNGQRVELLEGEVLVMSPMSPRHALHVHLAAEALRARLGEHVWVRQQLPLDLGDASEPEPDVSVVAGSHTQYADHHPSSALLVIEASDSSLAFDRGRKGSLYAKHRIQEYWVVNLVDHQLEVYREPIADDAQPYGWRYATRTVHARGGMVELSAIPGASVPVDCLFPVDGA